MADHTVPSLMSLVQSISTTLNTDPGSWRVHVQAIRSVIASLDFQDTQPVESQKNWQLPVITAFQQVAYADADSGGVADIGDWCLRQALALLNLFPEDIAILTLIGRNWLSRAQKHLAIIYHEEQSSSSSGAGSSPPSQVGRHTQVCQISTQPEERIGSANYVEARGLLLPAIEYLKRAVDTTRAQGNVQGSLLCSTAEAYMSLGNVSSTRVNGPYFSQAVIFLRAANDVQGYTLPEHLQQYLEEYGPLVD